MATNFENPNRAKVDAIRAELTTFGTKYGLRGLDGRVERGLDPAGLLAVEETRNKLLQVTTALGTPPDALLALTNDLHVGGIWKNADRLADGKDPSVRGWMVAAEISVRGREKEGNLDTDQFVMDLQRINTVLDSAVADPEKFAVESQVNLIEKSKSQFTIEDGVPFSTLDNGFLAMAINGYKAGITETTDGLLFVGADELDYRVLEESGFRAIIREDRGRQATFYVDEAGVEVVKKIYPGFAIVLKDNVDLAQQRKVAKILAKSGMAMAVKKRETSTETK